MTTIEQKPRRRAGRPRYQDMDVLAEVEAQVRAHPRMSAPALRDHLDALFPRRGPNDLRTLRAIMEEYRPLDPSGPWALAHAEPEDAALVLRARLAALQRLGVDGWQITHGHAEWIVRVSRIAPSIPPWWAWWEGHKYSAREQQKQPTDDLDLLLAVGPWDSETSFEGFASLARGVFRWNETRIPGGILDACRMQGERTGEPVSAIYKRYFRGEGTTNAEG